MADRFPLILNTSANQIQEIGSGDQLDLSGNNIANAGIITAGNVTIGAATTDLVVTGDARITGILTIGTSSLKLDGPNNLVNVGTALTLGHSQGLQFHTQNLDSAGFEVNQINVSGASTIGGNIDANGDLDVDGHTNLDNVNIVGVVTVTGAVNASHSTFGNLNTTGITIQNTNASLNFTDSNNNPDYSIIVDGGVFDLNSVTPAANIIKINTDGHIDIGTNVDFAAGIDVTGNATVSGNLSVGGVLTYEDVTNVDSVGLVTARDGVFLPDLKQLKIGNTAAAPDLYLWHNSSTGNSNISNKTGDLFIQGNNGSGTVVNQIAVKSNAAVELNYQGNKKFETTNTGAVVTGIMTATTLSSGNLRITDDGATGPLVSILADDSNPYALMIGNSSYSNTAPFGLNFFNNNSGEGYFRHIGNGSYKDYHFSLHDTSNNKLCIKFEGDDQSVELYGRGTKDLETTGTGVVVSGVCTATTFVGNVTGTVTGTASGNATISSNGDNRIITGGSGNALTGESSLTYGTYLSIVNSRSDTNFGDNSAPGGVNGIFISNSQSTNGVFSAITLSANDANGTNQSGSLVAKSVSGGYVPEVHITQRTANNTNESNFKITNTRSVQLRHQGSTRLETTTEGVKIGRTMFTGSTTNVENEAVVISPSINTGNGYHDNHVVSIGQLNGNWSEGLSGADSAFGMMFSYANGSNAAKQLRGGIVYDHKSTEELQIWSSYGSIAFYQDLANNGNRTPVTCDTKCAEFDTNGHFVPGANNGRDLGTSSKRWRNIYTNDLNLSNEGGVNKVDGTWGNYTIQEGESDLFLINKRNGKKYKFNLTEVS